jgi:hypothetical protein
MDDLVPFADDGDRTKVVVGVHMADPNHPQLSHDLIEFVGSIHTPQLAHSVFASVEKHRPPTRYAYECCRNIAVLGWQSRSSSQGGDLYVFLRQTVCPSFKGLLASVDILIGDSGAVKDVFRHLCLDFVYIQ